MTKFDFDSAFSADVYQAQKGFQPLSAMEGIGYISHVSLLSSENLTQHLSLFFLFEMKNILFLSLEILISERFLIFSMHFLN